MRRLLLLAPLLLASCGDPDRDKGLSAVRRILVDPESAQFRDVVVKRDKGAVCGEVNAKNRMGGYVGFSPFYTVQGFAYIKPTEGLTLTGDQLSAEAERIRFDTERIRYCG